MNRDHKIFLTKSQRPYRFSEGVLLCREALAHLFPGAHPLTGPCEKLASPSSYFLRDGQESLWVEIVPTPFTRVEICDYLARARQVQPLFPSGITGILVAPEFEPGARELLELIEFPIRCLRYQEATPLGPREEIQDLLRGPLLWIESVLAFSSGPGKPVSESPALREEPLTPPPETSVPCQRLNREELREFIQLELDAVSGRVIGK